MGEDRGGGRALEDRLWRPSEPVSPPRTEFPFPKPDMISRLDGEEESRSSDTWPLQGGGFAGTATKPVQRPSRAGWGLHEAGI